MKRMPSLREVRRRCPKNVVILPTAANRQVRQDDNLIGARARRKLRDCQVVKFPYIAPYAREADRAAAVIMSVEQTPALLLVHAILASLDRETKQSVVDRLANQSGESPAQRQALEIAKATLLNVGDSAALVKAFARFTGER
jgi:Lon protease-like protein